MSAPEVLVRQPSLIMQWIVSLAVSIVSCSVLFVIFAAHLVQVQSRVTIDSVRLEAALQRQSQLVLEVSDMRQALLNVSLVRPTVQTDGVVTPELLTAPEISSQPAEVFTKKP